jgi:molecular chaperone DnaK (HSP70)
MSQGLAIDFGASNTRLATWDTAEECPVLIHLPAISLKQTQAAGTGVNESVPYIPSVIHYSQDHTWIGAQIRERGLEGSPGLFRWMKRYISNRLEIPRKIGERSITMSRAGSDFLKTVIASALDRINPEDDEVIFTTPVETFENYTNWLMGLCRDMSLSRVRFIDEASSAALGYALSINSNDVIMIFDFGGGTLDVSIVRMEDVSSPRGRCSVIGKAGAELGGANLDQWLFSDILDRNNLKPEEIPKISGLLLLELERAKQRLTFYEKADVTVTDPMSGEVINHVYTRSQFEEILDKNRLFETIQSVVDRALANSRERGYDRDALSAVALIGGSSLIPSVRRSVKQMFGELVSGHRPLDAVVRGAAKFGAGVDFFDHIQHDYAIRYYNRSKGEHDFKLVIPSGAAYPTNGPVAKIMVSASYDDQEYLGLELYEVGNGINATCKGAQLDLVFDPQGCARFLERRSSEMVGKLWINENCPTFIHAEPKARRGERRFPVEFSIDGLKRLCVTVRDLGSNRIILQDHPVIKLV